MNLLSFYTSEKQHHADMPLYEWLLEEALRPIGNSPARCAAGGAGSGPNTLFYYMPRRPAAAAFLGMLDASPPHEARGAMPGRAALAPAGSVRPRARGCNAAC